MSGASAEAVVIKSRTAGDLRSRVLALMERRGISQGQLSDDIGKSRSVVSSWLSDKYPHDSYIVPALEAWLVREQGGLDEVHVLETRNLKRVFEACLYAVEHLVMTLIIGKPGLGKTLGMRHFYRTRHSAGEETVYYHCAPLVRPASLARKLARLFQLQENKSAHDLVEDVVARLKRRTAVLLFDEANHLSIPCLEVIRYIHDCAQTPVVLCGSRRLQQTLVQVTDRYSELEQLQSRIPCKIVLQELTLSETRAFFADAFPDGYPEEALKEGHELCRGVPRDLAAGLKNSRRIMSRNGLKAPTVEVISKAFRAGVL